LRESLAKPVCGSAIFVKFPNPLTFTIASGSSPPAFWTIDASQSTFAPVKPHLNAVIAQKAGEMVGLTPQNLTFVSRFLPSRLTKAVNRPKTSPKIHALAPPESAHLGTGQLDKALSRALGHFAAAKSRKTSPLPKPHVYGVS
jgi:hypothetical protein